MLPFDLIDDFIIETHELNAHIGIKKCLKMISEKFTGKNLKKKITNIIKTCNICQKSKIYCLKNYFETRPIIPGKPRELISVDYYGPLPMSKGIINIFLRWLTYSQNSWYCIQ